MKYRLIIKLILLILVIACAGPFLLKDKSGMPLMTIDKIKWPKLSMPEVPRLPVIHKNTEISKEKPVETELLLPSETEPVNGQDYVKIYTYKDKNGVSHYTNKTPEKGDFKTIYMPIRKDEESTLKKIKEKIGQLTEKIVPSKSTPDLPSTSSGSDLSLPDIYANPKRAINEAIDLKKQVEQSYQEREKNLKNLN